MASTPAQTSDPTIADDQYNSWLTLSLDELLPKTITLKRIKRVTPAPWYTPELNLLRKECKRAERSWRKDKATVKKAAFRTCLKNYKTALRNTKSSFFQERIANSSCSAKETFIILKELLKVPDSAPKHPPDPKADEEKCTKLAKFFEEKIQNILVSLPAIDYSTAEEIDDASFWNIPVPDHLRVEIIKRGSASFQNIDGPFRIATRQDPKAKGDVRQLSKEWFYKVMPNGEKVLRSWMVYSLVSDKLYCFCCRLFASNHATDTTSKFVTGFQTWWKLSPKVHNHETSEEHLHCLEKWKTLAAGLRLHKTIDAKSIALMDIEKKKWRDILHRLLDITLVLAKQNLAFRGHNGDESSLNKGNFLEMVEMLSKYDSVLKEHLMRLKRSTCKLKASVSYLAPQTQNEFIHVLANHVKEKLVMDIKSARYFGIMFDSTPDTSHTDQKSEVIRYVKIQNRKVEVREVFLGFLPLKGKKAVDLSSDILKNLESDGLDIMMCRAQGYDNAATTAGIHGVYKPF
ncbi:zinc finger MYM-type protein 1-like [Lissotriton helveticus]